MNGLQMFGFPASLQEDNTITAGADVSWLDSSRKYAKGMYGLLADSGYRQDEEPYYDFYKSIGRDGEREHFANRNLRYDCTVIMPGRAGDEYKKTAGHFHCPIPAGPYSYPEYYQVIHGKALFIMQRVTNCHTEGAMEVTDVILAEANAGESVVIPPEYGHCTVNLGGEALVFANLVSNDSSNFYDGVKRSKGMCCYIKAAPGGGFAVEPNPSYRFASTPRTVKAGESNLLGVEKNVPVYARFVSDPDKYAYLDQPVHDIAVFVSAFA